MLLPLRVLGVLNHTRAGDGGLRDANGDVRVAGDHPAVLVNLGVTAVTMGMGLGVAGGTLEGVTGSEATAEALGGEVHVGQPPSFVYDEVEVSMEVNDLLRSGIGHGRQS